MAYLSEAWQVRACKDGAAEFASALLTLLEAEKALKKAKKSVPGYTGDRSCGDYVANEQEYWNRAADILFSKITS
jgi:hypothetical protein